MVVSVRQGDFGLPAGDARRLRIYTTRWVDSIFTGEYRSAFRGRGIEFDEVREYQPGDDIRSIDWNVTARSGRPFIKRYIEERQITVMILLDRSSSLEGVGPRKTKAQLAQEICALMILAAARSNDCVGLMAFADRVECYIPPGKGMRHAARLLAELSRPRLSAERGTDLAGALRYFDRVQRRPCIAVLVSDFIADEFQRPLAALVRRHDVVAISLTDIFDRELPDVGLLHVKDMESDNRRLIDTHSPAMRLAYRSRAQQKQAEIEQCLRAVGVGHLAVATDASPAQALTRFFAARASQRSR
jgi:uncharacterized protein (DUF58 family)